MDWYPGLMDWYPGLKDWYPGLKDWYPGLTVVRTFLLPASHLLKFNTNFLSNPISNSGFQK
jgi:hypothetical protein